MIDKNKFNSIRKDIEKYDNDREILIKKCRDVLKASKLLIYSIHRNQEVTTYLNEVKKQKKLLDTIITKNKKLLFEGSYSEACQEYAESLTYYHFVKDNKLVYSSDIGVCPEDYLMGVCDLTGELARKAVMSAINKDKNTVKQIYDFVDEILNEFLKFSFRNGHLRKKSDTIKWNLKKIEEVLYDMK